MDKRLIKAINKLSFLHKKDKYFFLILSEEIAYNFQEAIDSKNMIKLGRTTFSKEIDSFNKKMNYLDNIITQWAEVYEK